MMRRGDRGPGDERQPRHMPQQVDEDDDVTEGTGLQHQRDSLTGTTDLLLNLDADMQQ